MAPRLAGAILATAACSAVGINLRPIIGILSMPNEGNGYDANGPGFFPASYVKWLEMAGARVVPLPFNQPESVRALLPLINGALFTGGGVAFTYKNGSLTPFASTASIIFNESVAAAAAGETWPLWGTCLGFELSE
jgi:gamma-glutamyl hydrolase